jgi:phosphoribosyl 1,2-cyclic phosphate phosphodiesterase
VAANPFAPEDYGRVKYIDNIEFVPFLVDHGTCMAVGYRFGDFGYTVDMKSLDDRALACLRGVKIWVVDAAAYHNPDNAVHANLESVYAYNDVIGAQAVYISSLSTLMDYQTLKDELRSGFHPAWDGIQFEI